MGAETGGKSPVDVLPWLSPGLWLFQHSAVRSERTSAVSGQSKSASVESQVPRNVDVEGVAPRLPVSLLMALITSTLFLSILPNALRKLNAFRCGFVSERALGVYWPSTSLLRSLKKSANHSSGFSGSYMARCFIPSSKCGVILELRYCLDGLAEAPEVAGGVCAAGGCAGRMLESCSGCAVAAG
ncbi:hypothetical protein KC349_g321 [Hortaea werneckii]|nr:hypothetical protein KC349_g321 [Hortaea werneckii]